ncbi:MAG: TonB-dependent receptor [Leadbetterella sp.]|nr:TonB-dependent receptor [Leadbetterella sp.]
MYIRITALLLLSLPLVHAQSTQNISGRITEQYSAFRVPFALVEVLNSTHRTYSDSLGYFRISGVPTGRVDLRISATGYKPRVLSYLELVAGKELVMNVELTEEVHLLREVVVTSGPRRESQNDMIKASRRHFSIEESKRYAGSLNDVQRMASSFAGVSTADDQVNDLIIRGNTPSGMLFRLDGMNIPNPNHWSMPGSSGGTVSMLNNNVLRNSDFLTGAFAAEYDAFSGVFDLKTRNGNFNRHEFMFQLGFNGLEAGAEGPLDKKRKSSYLFNYRKSLLEVLSTIITPKTGTAVPKYQDLFFKIHFPTRNAGTFSLTGMGGTSDIHFEPDAEKTNNYTFDDLRSGSNTGLAGISHQLSPRRALPLTPP